MKNDLAVYKKLSKLVTDEIIGVDFPRENIVISPLQTNYFSSCFSVDTFTESGHKGFYLKIPRVNIRQKIMPIKDNDRRFAQEEYRSLLDLSKFWNSEDSNISFVKPIRFFEDYNAIVTERVYASDIFHKFRLYDLKRKLGIGCQNDPMPKILAEIGTALRRFHRSKLAEILFTVDETLAKMEGYYSRLKSFGINGSLDNHIKNLFGELRGFSAPTEMTKTLKGLDIRNVLIDDFGQIFMLDPGKIKLFYKEADLARFLVTCRILYWGGILFPLHFSPCLIYEKSFLEGYFGKSQITNGVLAIFIIKELLKHWYDAHANLRFKKWPEAVKNFLKKTYIDPFYKNQLAFEIAHRRK